MRGSTNRRITGQARPGIKRDPISKIPNTERAGGGVQVVEHPPSEHKALSSSPSTKQKQQKTPFILQLFKYTKVDRIQESPCEPDLHQTGT
jgi:hypothetical protein